MMAATAVLQSGVFFSHAVFMAFSSGIPAGARNPPFLIAVSTSSLSKYNPGVPAGLGVPDCVGKPELIDTTAVFPGTPAEETAAAALCGEAFVTSRSWVHLLQPVNPEPEESISQYAPFVFMIFPVMTMDPFERRTVSPGPNSDVPPLPAFCTTFIYCTSRYRPTLFWPRLRSARLP